MKRREFLGTAVAGTAGTFVLSGVAPAAPADLDPTATVPLGTTLKVSRIGFGTGMRGWEQQSNQTRLGEAKLRDLFRYVYDQGIRLFDMADLYGTHGHCARALKDKPRDSYTLVSKIWWREGGGLPTRDRPDADAVVGRFLQELQTDYIDLVQLHCVTSPTWPDELRKQMELLEDLKQKGKIRAHGVSCHSIGALEAAAGEPWVEVVHTRLNPYGTKMDGPADEVVPALNKIREAGKGLIVMKVIGEGQFRDDRAKRKASVRFVVGSGLLGAMIVGFESPQEVDELKSLVGKALAQKAAG
jgi:aryl-alcohol dehydrogenase-like predicted oxidoreductase